MSTHTFAEIRQALRYYAGHRVTRGIAYAASASLIATAAIGVPQVIDAHTAQTNRVATAHRLIDGQLDITETTRSELVEQITAAEKVAKQAGKEGALPEKHNLREFRDAIAGAEAQLADLDAQTAATKKADAAEDVHSWLPHVIGEQADELGEAFNDLRTEAVAAGKIDLGELTDTVRAEMKAKAEADKKAADEKAAAEAAALAAAEAEAAEAAVAQAAEHVSYSPGAEPQQQQTQDAATDCRAQAVGLVASLSGAPVVWADLGAYGAAAAGQVTLGGGPTVSLSSGTDDSYWCSAPGQYVAAHEAAHALHDGRLDTIKASGYSWEWQLARAEQAADCIAHGWGYTGAARYGCTPEGQELARLILG